MAVRRITAVVNVIDADGPFETAIVFRSVGAAAVTAARNDKANAVI